MKNAVLLAPYFLPRRRVGSWRPFKFAIHLREYGWQPHVITIADQSGRLTAKEQALLTDIPIHRLSPLFDFTSSSGSQLNTAVSESKGNENEATKPAASQTDIIQPALDWIDKQCPIDTWLPFLWLKYRRVKQIVREVNPEVLWSTGDPWSSHWLGKRLAHHFSLPWVADFRDPWTLGEVNLKNRSSFSSAVDKRAERDVTGQATALTFTSRTTEHLYRQHYPEQDGKMHTLYNAYDEELYNENEQVRQELFDADKLNLLFFGKFRRLSPAHPFISVLAAMNPDKARKVRMYSFGPLSDADRSYADSCNVLDNFIQLDPIPPEAMRAVLPGADILWLSTDQKRSHIIPAKLWDYLAAGRPVLSVAPNPEIGDILSNTGTGVQLSPDDRDAAKELLTRCVNAKHEGKELPLQYHPDTDVIREYEAANVTRSLAELFDTLT